MNLKKNFQHKEDEENIQKSKEEIQKARARMEILKDNLDITQNLNR